MLFSLLKYFIIQTKDILLFSYLPFFLEYSYGIVNYILLTFDCKTPIIPMAIKRA